MIISNTFSAFMTYPKFIIVCISAIETAAVGISLTTIFPSTVIVGPAYSIPKNAYCGLIASVTEESSFVSFSNPFFRKNTGDPLDPGKHAMSIIYCLFAARCCLQDFNYFNYIISGRIVQQETTNCIFFN